jgi:prepilin-type N-terminal cleavage/methylation domain-containing protein
MMNKKENSIRNDKGFSLIEILVVVAIIAILLTASVLSLSYINRTNRRQAANNVLSYVGNAQTAAETRIGLGEYVDYGFAIYSNGNGETNVAVVQVKADGSDFRVVSTDVYKMSKQIPVVVNTSGASYNMTNSAHKIVVTFDRTSGVCKTLYVDGSASGDTMSNISFGGGASVVKFVWSTGKFSLE